MDDTIKHPKVTVLMPVYNGETYLREAIDSILAQTYTDFEFLIIDDGSTDTSADIIKSYKDERIVYIANEGNKGLPYTLNRGIELARGEYIARMDADDVSLPMRLAKQVAFMEAHSDVGMCGTWIETIGDRAGHVQKYLTDADELKANLLFHTSFAHPSVMLRKSILMQHQLRYNPDNLHFEDYGLWIALSSVCKLANIPEVLLQYRLHPASISHTQTSRQKDGALLLRTHLLEALGLHPKDADMTLHNALGAQETEDRFALLDRQEAWLLGLNSANEKTHRYAPEALAHILFMHWQKICEINARGGMRVWKKYAHSPLHKIATESHVRSDAKLFIKCLLKRR